MRAVDTNVLVRLIRRDDEKQAAAADEYIAEGAWVSSVALAEAIWVLGTVYGRNAKEQARTVEMLLAHGRIVLQDAEAVETALELFRAHPTLDFSDCLLVALARQAGHTPMGTFDRKLSKLPGAERI